MTEQRVRLYGDNGLALPLYRAGDIVRLRSGGPDMSVQSAEQGCCVRACWFDGYECREGGFVEESLELVADAPALGAAWLAKTAA